jgi:hypothetical protein
MLAIKLAMLCAGPMLVVFAAGASGSKAARTTGSLSGIAAGQGSRDP